MAKDALGMDVGYLVAPDPDDQKPLLSPLVWIAFACLLGLLGVVAIFNLHPLPEADTSPKRPTLTVGHGSDELAPATVQFHLQYAHPNTSMQATDGDGGTFSIKTDSNGAAAFPLTYRHSGIYKATVAEGSKTVSEAVFAILGKGWESNRQLPEGPRWMAGYVPEGAHVQLPALEVAGASSVRRLYQHRLVRPFGVVIDSMGLRAWVRNASTCAEEADRFISLKLQGDAGVMHLQLARRPLEAPLYVQVSDVLLDTVHHKKELAMLEQDLSNWRLLQLKVRDRTLIISLDGQQLLSVPYTVPCGRLQAITFSTAGTGELQGLTLGPADGLPPAPAVPED